MGRKSKVSRAEALDSAMRVFWEKGYADSSVDDLQKAIGIQRGSFYFHFSDKRKLFLEVLNHYRRVVVEPRQQSVREAKSPLEGILLFYGRIVSHLATNRKQTGCLNTNTAVELASRDREIATHMQRNLQEWIEFWRETVCLAKNFGEIPENSDTRTIAEGLVLLTNGLNVLGKITRDESALRAMAETMLTRILGVSLPARALRPNS